MLRARVCRAGARTYCTVPVVLYVEVSAPRLYHSRLETCSFISARSGSPHLMATAHARSGRPAGAGAGENLKYTYNSKPGGRWRRF